MAWLAQAQPRRMQNRIAGMSVLFAFAANAMHFIAFYL